MYGLKSKFIYICPTNRMNQFYRMEPKENLHWIVEHNI